MYLTTYVCVYIYRLNYIYIYIGMCVYQETELNIAIGKKREEAEEEARRAEYTQDR